jgi:ribosomal protein L12E/L44/L45/RPP1/RPP2
MQEDQDFYDEESGQQNAGKNPLRQHIKELEKEVNDLRQLKAEAETAKRELAFAKAGIPMDSPIAKYFIKGYDGELTPEAIHEAATEAGLVAQPKPNPLKQEAEAWARSNQVAAGINLSDEPVDWATRIANATSEKEVMEILSRAQETLS